MFNKQGEIRQCNEGKYGFHLREYDHPEYTYFELEVPKHLETKDLEVNIDPHWVSVRVRGKLTQLRLNDEISVTDSKTERSQITGILKITMKKVTPQPFLTVTDETEDKKKEKQKKEQIKKECEEKERTTGLQLCA